MYGLLVAKTAIFGSPPDIWCLGVRDEIADPEVIRWDSLTTLAIEMFSIQKDIDDPDGFLWLKSDEWEAKRSLRTRDPVRLARSTEDELACMRHGEVEALCVTLTDVARPASGSAPA